MANDSLLQLIDGCKSYGTKELLIDASFAINENEHCGVIGPNGAGKTTLFKILLGQEELNSGKVIQARALRLGYLSQHDNFKVGQTGEEYLIENAETPIWELKGQASKLGLNDALFEKELLSLSGGYRMRFKLLALVGQNPNLMLLDEPTNYLDLETTFVLERFLQNFEGAFLLISHDREFLKRTTDHTLEVELGEITKYNGNIDDYFEQKALIRTQLEAQAATQAEKRKVVMDFVNRFGAKASKAKQAQSRLKSLEKMETIELKELPNAARIKIPDPTKTGKQVLKVTDVKLGYGERVILEDVNVTLMSGDHLAIVGYNGAGKSTFLKALAGRLTPFNGKIEFGLEVKASFFAQHVVEELNPDHTVLQSVSESAHFDVKAQEILDMAGSFLFSGDDIKKRISVLSGGEKSRVALVRMLLKKTPFLILDEPTNHLDFTTVEALTEALKKFPGTVVVVSHDRGFVSRVGTKIFEVSQGKVRVYPGTYDEYVWSVQKGSLSLGKDIEKNSERFSASVNDGGLRLDTVAPAKPTSALNREEKKNAEKNLKQALRVIEKCESEMKQGEDKLAALNAELLNGDSATRKTVDVLREMGDAQKVLTQLETDWMSAVQKKEEAESVLKT